MRRLRKALAIGVATIIFGLSSSRNLNAEVETKEYLKVNATAYCVHGVTASGEYTREGICASRRCWIGNDIWMYQCLPDGSVGELIGIYECKDTGGYQVANGINVDVWCPDMGACQEFMDTVYEDGCKGKVYIRVTPHKNYILRKETKNGVSNTRTSHAVRRRDNRMGYDGRKWGSGCSHLSLPEEPESVYYPVHYWRDVIDERLSSREDLPEND